MSSIFKYNDQDLGTKYIVVSKIREISKTFGELVVTFDNGDKSFISVENPEETLKDLIEAIKKI
nr:hypothetical protein [Candidatus Cloacimonadota bacterium]